MLSRKKTPSSGNRVLSYDSQDVWKLFCVTKIYKRCMKRSFSVLASVGLGVYVRAKNSAAVRTVGSRVSFRDGSERRFSVTKGLVSASTSYPWLHKEQPNSARRLNIAKRINDVFSGQIHSQTFVDSPHVLRPMISF